MDDSSWRVASAVFGDFGVGGLSDISETPRLDPTSPVIRSRSGAMRPFNVTPLLWTCERDCECGVDGGLYKAHIGSDSYDIQPYYER